MAVSSVLPPQAYTGVVAVGAGTAAPMVRLTLLPSLSQPVVVLYVVAVSVALPVALYTTAPCAFGSMRLLRLLPSYQRTSSPLAPGVPASVTSPAAHSVMSLTVGRLGFVFIVIGTATVSL